MSDARQDAEVGATDLDEANEQATATAEATATAAPAADAGSTDDGGAEGSTE